MKGEDWLPVAPSTSPAIGQGPLGGAAYQAAMFIHTTVRICSSANSTDLVSEIIKKELGFVRG